MSAGWIAAGVVSAVAHLGFAAWVEQKEPAKKRLPPIEMQLSKVPPKLVPPPPPPPPPPRKQPLQVKRVAKLPPRPIAQPETQRVGITEETSAPTSEVAVAPGVTTDGTLGTGTALDKTLPPPPPEAPKPAPPPKQKVFPSYEVTQLPRPRHVVQPEIPEAFRQAQREALVVIELELDVRGHVVSARVVRHADFGLDDAALAAAKHTEFEPALVGLQPVAVRFQIPYRFKVRG